MVKHWSSGSGRASVSRICLGPLAATFVAFICLPFIPLQAGLCGIPILADADAAGLPAIPNLGSDPGSVLARHGTNGPVHALVIHDQRLIIGGVFEYADGKKANYVAAWDGSTWDGIGDLYRWEPDMCQPSPAILALTVLDGALIAGGRILTLVDRLRHSRWHGLGFVFPGDGFGEVTVLTVYDGQIVGAGNYISSNAVACYDGSNWQQLASGMNGRILALTVFEDKLIAGGKFTNAGGVSVNYIAQWEDTTWVPICSGLDGPVHALTIHQGKLVAGGSFTGGVAVLNDSSWKALDGLDTPVKALGVHQGDLVAAGGSGAGFAARWNGQVWVGLGAFNSPVSVLRSYGGDLYAGGDFTAVSGTEAYYIAYWDGDRWYSLGPPDGGYDLDLNNPVYRLATYEGDLIAVSGTWIGRWVEDHWVSLGSGDDGTIEDLAVYRGDLIAAGEFTKLNGSPMRHIARWDGAAWSEIGSGVNGSVYALTVYDGSLIVGGGFTEAGGVPVENIAAWDGEVWAPVGSGCSKAVDEVAVWDGKLLAAAGRSIQIWDGDNWREIGKTSVIYDSRVFAMVPFEGDLVVAGDFGSVNDVTDLNNIARWDGTSWKAMGEGLKCDSGYPFYRWGVYSLICYKGSLIAGGSFEWYGYRNLARWSGAVWRGIGCGPSGWVHALAGWDDHLIVGGSFQTAFCRPDQNVAAYDFTVVPVAEFKTVGWDTSVVLSWKNPEDSRFVGTLIRFSPESYPDGLSLGEPLPNGNDGRFEGLPGSEAGFVHTGLAESMTYYYSAFAYNAAGRHSPVMLASAMTNPLGPVSDFEAVAGVGSVKLQWKNPPDEGCRGTLIHFSAKGYAPDPLSGKPVPNGNNGRFDGLPGSSGCFEHLGLEDGQTYYYSAFVYDSEGNLSTPEYVSVATPELEAFAARADDREVRLEWTYPYGPGFSGVLIRYSTQDYPSDHTDGDPVPNGKDGRFEGGAASDSAFMHGGLTNGITYYYSAFIYDTAHYSGPAWASVMPKDSMPPQRLVSFTAGAEDDSVRLRWTNPWDDDFRGTLIRFSDRRYPVDPQDCCPVHNENGGRFEGAPGSDSVFLHVEVSEWPEGKTVYYKAWAYDQGFNYSVPVYASARHDGAVCDTIPPELGVGVYQSPARSESLRVYLAADNTLLFASIDIIVDGVWTPLTVADSVGYLWVGDFKLPEVANSRKIRIDMCAADQSGNFTCKHPRFCSGLLTHQAGGAISSPDGRLTFEVAPGIMAADVNVLVLPIESQGDWGGLLDLSAEDVTFLADVDETAIAYRISPTGVLRGGSAHLTLSYRDMGLGPGILPDRLYIDQEGVGPLECYVDPDNESICACVNKVGTFRLSIGDPGTSTVANPWFLSIGRISPNPFTATTRVQLDISMTQGVRISVYDVRGRLVATLFDGAVHPGFSEFHWDGRNATGIESPSGIYFLKVDTEHKTATAKICLVR